MATVKTYKGHDVPEGAICFGAENEMFEACFYKDGFYWAVNKPGWRVEYLAIKDPNYLENLPQEPEQFVPKVGEECEINLDFKWQTVYICGKNKGGAFVFEDHRGYVDSSIAEITKFRPIKTEREKVIEWAVKEWKREDYPAIGNFFGSMYDLGALTLPESK